MPPGLGGGIQNLDSGQSFLKSPSFRAIKSTRALDSFSLAFILSYGAYGTSGLAVKTHRDPCLGDTVIASVVEICTGYKNSSRREREPTLLCGKTQKALLRRR